MVQKVDMIIRPTSWDLGDVIGVQHWAKDWVDAGDTIGQLMHPGLAHDNAVGSDEAPGIV